MRSARCRFSISESSRTSKSVACLRSRGPRSSRLPCRRSGVPGDELKLRSTRPTAKRWMMPRCRMESTSSSRASREFPPGLKRAGDNAGKADLPARVRQLPVPVRAGSRSADQCAETFARPDFAIALRLSDASAQRKPANSREDQTGLQDLRNLRSRQSCYPVYCARNDRAYPQRHVLGLEARFHSRAFPRSR